MTIDAILVATDFSESSAAALDEARLLAGRFAATLHILHVVADPLHETWSGFVPVESLMKTVEGLRSAARQRIEALLASGDRAGRRVVVATAWGDPAEQILKYVRDEGIDLLVCGTHGRHGWNRLMMGSVAERIVRLAPCPVLSVHAAARAA